MAARREGLISIALQAALCLPSAQPRDPGAPGSALRLREPGPVGIQLCFSPSPAPLPVPPTHTSASDGALEICPTKMVCGTKFRLWSDKAGIRQKNKIKFNSLLKRKVWGPGGWRGRGQAFVCKGSCEVRSSQGTGQVLPSPRGVLSLAEGSLLASPSFVQFGM